MKKFLSVLLLFLSFGFLFPKQPVHAQVAPPAQQLDQLKDGEVPAGSWVIDPEVTFIGKNAARSGQLLDFTLKNYNWVCVKQVSATQCDNRNNPLTSVWLTTVTYIVVPLLFVIIIATAIIIIVTRGRSLTIMRFLPRFIAVILLIFFSFPLLQFFYQFIDVIQGFFLRSNLNPCPPECISQVDLLYVGWDYETFQGLRRLGDQYAESAFISLLLTKLTALTYYVMVAILILRRIILWLFIIVSPIFPLLLLYYPIRNTGKIWIGEFFRWLLYAPLFAIFLKGLVSLWRNQIPLVFSNPNIGVAGKEIYPTAVNILLGGPKQYVTPTNSVNLTETFALYVVSLIMLWGVIILPWILLQIFLDYASNIGVGDSAVMKTLVNKISNLQPPGSPSHPPAGGGSTINLPFSKKFNLPVAPPGSTGMARELPISTSKTTQTSYMPSAQVKAQVLNLANVPLPTMRDIAKYDTSLLSKDKDRQKETTTIRENLLKIGNPASSTSSTERERFTEIHEKLTQESKSGNTLATSILNAANVANKRSMQATTSQIKNVLTQIANPQAAATSSAAATGMAGGVVNKEKITKMNESLVQAKKQGNTLAASILAVNEKTSTAEIEKLQEKIMDAKTKGDPIAQQIAGITEKQKAGLPVVNRVQTVSKEDYQAVKDMWKENYKNLEVPEGMAGTRTEWIKGDMTKIEEIIGLLSSQNEEQVEKGMAEVSGILPFLLVGGFSQAEILSYLKAKLDAAKEVATEIAQDEEDKVTIDVKKTATATGHLAASLPDTSPADDDTDDSDLGHISTSSTQQVSSEILDLINMKLPKISDIARYESLSLSKDKQKTSEIEKMQDVLRSINDPASVTNASEKQRYGKIRQKLVEDSAKGNIMAQAVLAAASGAKTGGNVASDTKTVLTQIANPTLSTSATDKERFVSLHDQLTQASKQGDSLATSLLSVKETATKEEVEKLNTQLRELSGKGHPLAASVLSNISPTVALPATNRIQTVSKEDYQAVKDMWKENYKTLDIPKELAENRTEWIKNDVAKIDTIVSQLSSSDATQVNQGMQEVASILPFLLVGGFSQSEIVSYLKAKQEAAKEVLTVVTKEEEETTVTIGKKTIETPQEKAAVQETSIGVADEGQAPVGRASIIAPQVSQEILTLTNLKLPKLSDIVSYEVRNLTKDKTESERIQKIQQVLERISNPQSITAAPEREQYEKLREKLAAEAQSGNVTADVILSAVSQLAQTAQKLDLTLAEIKVVLQQIVNPEKVAVAEDKDYYTRLHEYLEKESKEKNNTLATKILSVNDSTSSSDVQQVTEQLMTATSASALPELTAAVNEFSQVKKLRKVITQIATPLPTASQAERESFTKLNDSLNQEKTKGNSLAASVLAVNNTTSDATLRKLHNDLAEGAKKGNPLARSILSKVTKPLAFSPANRLQQVTEEDYKEAYELWKKAYKQYLVPQGYTEDLKGRMEWINSDKVDIETTLSLLRSEDPDKRNEGTQKVSGILPFLLLGGYSYDEMLKYLDTKLDAGQDALRELQAEEDSSVTVPVSKAEEKPKTMEATDNSDENDKTK